LKKTEKIAVVIAILMIGPLFFGFIGSFLLSDLEPAFKDNLSESQIKEISSSLKLELKGDEHIYIEYRPTVLQATVFLKVYIENIESEESFLSRFKGTTRRGSNFVSYGDLNGSVSVSKYDIEIFELERRPKDYMCGLLFFYNWESESTTALFSISGYIPELRDIYSYFGYSYNIKPLLRNRMFMIPLCIEFVLITFLILSACSRFIRKRRSSPV
jgi:hypothetical protein